MNASVRPAPPVSAATAAVTFQTDKGPNAPCHLREHWQFTHKNGVCSKQQHCRAGNNSFQGQRSKSQAVAPGNVSDADKIKRYNQLVAAGVVGYNATAETSLPTAPDSSTPTPDTNTSCQFSTSYNATAHKSNSNDITVNFSSTYPTCDQPQRPTLADTACNRHMFGDAMLLDDLHDVPPVWINVANADKLSRVMANRVGTARLDAIDNNGAPIVVDIHNVLYSPNLPANLISITSLYETGYRIVDPYYGAKSSDLNLYLLNDKHIIPAFKEDGPGGFWRVFHHSEPRAYLTKSSSPDIPPPDSIPNLWHLRFGHLNHRSAHDIVEDVLRANTDKPSKCEACTMGKQTRSSHSGKLPRSQIPLYRIHCDLAGPFPTQSIGGYLYTMVLIDDATRKNWIILLKCKSHAFNAFKQFHMMITTQTSFLIAIFKTDRGGEFNSSEFSSYLAEHGIAREMGPPESPEQNSVVERFNRTAFSDASRQSSCETLG